MKLRTRIAALMVAASASAAGADIYECRDARGQPRYTDFKPDAKACKLVSVYRPAANTSAIQTKAVTPPAVDLAWLSTARENPDPRERLRALEEWSRGPRDWLDPVTHALVDPDDAVRARAHQLLLEQAWRR